MSLELFEQQSRSLFRQAYDEGRQVRIAMTLVFIALFVLCGGMFWWGANLPEWSLPLCLLAPVVPVFLIWHCEAPYDFDSRLLAVKVEEHVARVMAPAYRTEESA